MLITHKIAWDKCLSHQLWPAIEKGWKDEDKEIHFFWGLAGNNIAEIRKQRELRINWVKENWTHEVSARGLMKTINFNQL